MTEILFTDTKLVKMTLTPTRLTLKFPKDSTKETIEKFKKYAAEISEKFKPELSHRGSFKYFNDKWMIYLQGNKLNQSYKFEFND